MPDTRPGNHGANRVNDFIYKHMTTVFADRLEGEIVSDPQSSIAQKAAQLRDGLLKIGVEDERITAVSAIAHIHHYQPPVAEADTGVWRIFRRISRLNGGTARCLSPKTTAQNRPA